MTTSTNTSITTAATATATALWTCVGSSHALSMEIALLCQAANENYKKAGEALAAAWVDMSGEVDDGKATRHLVEACLQTSMARKSASKFLNGMGLVTRQRISQLLSVVYDGDKSKNNGNKPKGEGESQDGLDKGKGFTFEQILASLKSLDKLTMEQAQILAAVAASKIG